MNPVCDDWSGVLACEEKAAYRKTYADGQVRQVCFMHADDTYEPIK